MLQPTNIVSTFIGEKFTDQKITDEESARSAIKSVYDRIGADDTVDLELTAVRPTETGTTYYIFNQVAGDVFVYGASVKVIVDKEGSVTGLVSAILPKVELAKAENWEIDAARAEEIVKKECEENGNADVETVEGSTEQTIIAVPKVAQRYQYAWVVYTRNFDNDSEMAYLAHYVDEGGEYLYAIPIAEPHNADAEAGDKAAFDFDKFEQSTWKGTLTLHDGTTKEAEVPVLIDKSDNSVILADGKRKILCADHAKWEYEDTLSPCVSPDNSFNNVDLLAYDTFIKVWDFFDGIGWTGPDGEGTPTVLLMNYVDSNGNPVDQAMYSGRQNGFQVFKFNRLNPDGENMDIVAHEFTHCITSTAMTVNLYLNDMGAINEGMSDVIGNLVEMLIANKPESAWLLGDSSGVGTLRSMKDPHEFQQPEFRWDTYYAPSVKTGTLTNDFGGVHVNSSLLNIVSYKLDKAGMPPDDQLYFWMNVAFAMSPRTDYSQMAQLLPWCMQQSGYSQYVDAIKAEIGEAGYTNLEAPSTVPDGSAKVTIDYNAQDLIDKGFVRLTLIPVGSDKEIMSWPSPDTTTAVWMVPAGKYTALATIGADVLSDCANYGYKDGTWQLMADDQTESDTIVLESGQTLELPNQGLPLTLDEVSK